MAVSHFPEKGGDADGTRIQGQGPEIPGVFYHHPCGDGLHSPKRVLAARLVPERLAD